MKIIQLSYSNYIGGASIAAARINSCLNKNNINSKLWVNEKLSNNQSLNTEEPFNKVVKNLKRLRRYLTWPLTKVVKTNLLIHHSVSLLPSSWVSLINNSDADVVNFHWLQRETISISDIAKIKKPIVWTLHDMWAFCGAEHYTNDNRWRTGYNENNRPDYESGFDINRWTWNRKKKYWKKPIQIITPSNWLASCVRDSTLMKNWPVTVIPNPIDTNQWKPIKKETARKILKLPQNTPLILFGAVEGVKDPRKGFDLLLEALEFLKIKNTNKSLELIVFGENKPLGQKDYSFPVHNLGPLKNNNILQTVYSAADAMVIPSRQDNLPNTAIESQACNTPVVSFNIGGLPDIIDHKKTGYLAKPFDTIDLANGIFWILKKYKKEQSNNDARKSSIIKFSEEEVSRKYKKIYTNLI